MLKPSFLNFPFQFYKNPYHYKNILSPAHFPTPATQNKYENPSYVKEEKNKSNKNTNDFLFDLFGLKIYNDDILLISLLYFLYSEGVKDDGLFIVLILLLLS